MGHSFLYHINFAFIKMLFPSVLLSPWYLLKTTNTSSKPIRGLLRFNAVHCWPAKLPPFHFSPKKDSASKTRLEHCSSPLTSRVLQGGFMTNHSKHTDTRNLGSNQSKDCNWVHASSVWEAQKFRHRWTTSAVVSGLLNSLGSLRSVNWPFSALFSPP